MRKRLKWLVHTIKALSPLDWHIRRRLISAGLLLGTLSILAPIYMRTHLATLANSYEVMSTNWKELDRIYDFSRLIGDTQSRIRAYAASNSPEWLAPIRSNMVEMEHILSKLQIVGNNHSHRNALLVEATESYKRWTLDAVIPILDHKIESPERQKLKAEPEALRTQQLLNALANEIREDNFVANQAVKRNSKKSVLVVTYGGVFFLIGFITLMLSLWFTLIPGLNALLSGSRELKAGNLDHRVHIAGHSETAQLGRAFNEMAVSLKAQNEKLKELNQLKTDFVSTVSHELRTPLTAIKGSIGLILGNVTGPIPGEAADMLKITQKNTDRLIRLINEVLDISKIEAGAIQMRFDKYSLVDTINHSIQAMEAFAKTQGIKLDWDNPQISPLVVIDRDRIEQVVTNLLSNAIKFTEPGGVVAVRCAWEDDRVIVEVQDTGEGIPEEFLDRIFQKFQQATGAANHEKEGTGLGLAIARAIVQEHGGAIWVNSKVHHGSTFAFSLPWNGTEFVEAKKTAKTKQKATRGRSILIIDNEQDHNTVLQKMLEHEGYEIFTATEGKTGVEIAMRECPSLILLDVLMPDMNGYEVQSLLQKTQGTENIPIVFITTAPDAHNDPRAAKAHAVLTKPLVPEEFKQWLTGFFTTQRAA